MNKFLSIIIPIYNAEKYLKKCMDSILFNVFDNVEIILINDGSTDSSLDICLDYAKIDKRIKTINNTNHGVSYSRNCGISNATGKYIMFVDSDDYLNLDWSKFVINNEYTEDIIYFNELIPSDTNKFELINYIIGINNPCIAGPVSKLFSREMLLKNKIFFNEDLINGEDMIFNLKCLKTSCTFKIVNFSFYMYRSTPNSTTKSFNSKIFDSDLRFFGYLQEIIEKFNIEQEQKKNIMNYSKIHSVIVLISRASYLSKFSEFKKCIKNIKSFEYNNYKCLKYSLFKDKIIYYLLKFNMSSILYFSFKIKHSIKKDKDEFIKI